MRKIQDLTNQKFGRLLVIKYYGKSKDGHSIWTCKCDCGNIINVTSNSLKTKNTKSCGCLHKEIARKRKGSKCNFYKHGKANTRLFNIFHGIKERCLNNSDRNYKLYGKKGIKICNEWLDKENGFINFYNWAINNGYSDNLTIDRIDVNGDYCPENCRWVDMKVQANNRTNNHLVTYNGKTHTISEWSKITTIKSDTLVKRLNIYKWSIEKTLTKK
jgi:hypothetical protein